MVGAHIPVVEAALEGRYSVRSEGDEKLAEHYLEKMLQNSITIPPLAKPEALTYINLLFAELHAAEEEFDTLREAAADLRRKNQLAVAMDEGIARGALGGELSADLASALETAARIGPPLARACAAIPVSQAFPQPPAAAPARGRPARTRSRPGQARQADGARGALHHDFEQLFYWQLDADGVSPVLGDAEALARDEKPKHPATEAEEWLLRPGIREWLELEPCLGGDVLGPYYTFSRDRLRKAVTAARLPAELQHARRPRPARGPKMD